MVRETYIYEPFSNSLPSDVIYEQIGGYNAVSNNGNGHGNGNGYGPGGNNGNGHGPGGNNGNGHGHGVDGNEGNGNGNNPVPIGNESILIVFILCYLIYKILKK